MKIKRNCVFTFYPPPLKSKVGIDDQQIFT